jgi:hypothetical protein
MSYRRSRVTKMNDRLERSLREQAGLPPVKRKGPRVPKYVLQAAGYLVIVSITAALVMWAFHKVHRDWAAVPPLGYEASLAIAAAVLGLAAAHRALRAIYDED